MTVKNKNTQEMCDKERDKIVTGKPGIRQSNTEIIKKEMKEDSRFLPV